MGLGLFCGRENTGRLNDVIGALKRVSKLEEVLQAQSQRTGLSPWNVVRVLLHVEHDLLAIHLQRYQSGCTANPSSSRILERSRDEGPELEMFRTTRWSLPTSIVPLNCPCCESYLSMYAWNGCQSQSRKFPDRMTTRDRRTAYFGSMNGSLTATT